MTDLDCGCRIMTDVIRLNEWNKPNWNYLLKTYANICGKCGDRQMKFQKMENEAMEKEKLRMKMFVEKEPYQPEEEPQD